MVHGQVGNPGISGAGEAPVAAAAFMLKPCAAKDADFLFRLYASTRAEELALIGWDAARQEPFLRQQFSAREQQYKGLMPQPDDRIIVQHGTAVGRLMVKRGQRAIKLVDIALLPEFRNAGLGSAVLRDLIGEAARAGLPLVLRVDIFNPAVNLYARLGFVKTRLVSVYHEMVRQPVHALCQCGSQSAAGIKF